MTEEEIARIIRDNDALVLYVLRGLQGIVSPEDIEDMAQNVREGMVVALRKFDASRGVPVMGFLTQCMYHTVYDFKRDHYRERHVVRRGTKYEISTSSLDAATGEDGRTFVDLLADEPPYTVEETILARDEAEEALGRLTPRAARYLRALAEGATLGALAAQDGLSKARIGQIVQEARRFARKDDRIRRR